MTKSELIERLADQARHIPAKELELAIKELLEQMAQTLQKGERIEIRGFGSFSLHYRAPRVGRNPKTGETVKLDGKYVPHFKPGKELRERVDASIAQCILKAADKRLFCACLQACRKPKQCMSLRLKNGATGLIYFRLIPNTY